MPSLADTLRQRREWLAALIDFPVLLWSGVRPARNFPANQYPFRASSHFLYFAGLPLERSAIQLQNGRMTLFLDDPSPAAALWHGTAPTRDQIAAQIGADAAYPYAELMPTEDPRDPSLLEVSKWAMEAATIGLPSPVRDAQSDMLDRTVEAPNIPNVVDVQLARAIVSLRMQHDSTAVESIKAAVQATLEAHRVGMQVTTTVTTEAGVRAAMEQVLMTHNMTTAYNSIVTIQGEVLHNEHYHHPLTAGDLLLVDVGAETATGWAADVTRTWPVSGQFSPTQRAVYDVVLAAHDAAIAAMAPGVEYRDIHLLACRHLAAGLVELGILQGQPDGLVEQDAHALFFPHGIGHLLGLDVHDMEDLGDLAGYAEGRQRSNRFGLGYLRLDRPLQPQMIVTIEPGFYQVPALLNDPQRRHQYRDVVNWERLEQFADVRGIRIEDDVLLTESGVEILTQDLPTQAVAIEQLVQSGRI
ncbi:aminopeptidase P N-terminal domain-containing protein [filamentous cyanobacterium LEGE 11480]|uniref:Xaa-Pro aminopeptidase n=1 Tax=Romeriopsis navalis LEGE 11480 TaxID=2777977 RepID=A0A928Z2L7_9CYAN|nr:aminopeptidase P family protein [Romeriopsis navalis]MBE9029674.1 aminopeptidase P N-terminal domain-containing protein [Romeriopsis navalis LEGE 11480]